MRIKRIETRDILGMRYVLRCIGADGRRALMLDFDRRLDSEGDFVADS
jgi:hypothetical protein